MIHYNSLWETMSNKHFTTYTLREKHNIGHGTVQRLQKNMPVSTYTLDRLCKILDCRLDEVAEYLPDEEAEKINKNGVILCFHHCRWNGRELWLPSRGPISLKK